MNREELQIAKIRFESIDRFLLLCNYSKQKGWLRISCSERLTEILLTRLNDLVLRFEHVEKVTINDITAFNMPLSSLTEVEDIKVVAIQQPSPEFFRQRFRVINIEI